MSRFFAGQRVRIRPLPSTIEKFKGAEAVFLCYGTDLVMYPGSWDDCCIRVFGKFRSSPSSDLEPILPEGHQPTTWSECLWRPDGSHKTEKVAEEGRAIALRSIL